MQLPYTKNESFPFTFNSYHVYITQWLRLSRDHSLLLIFFFKSYTKLCTAYMYWLCISCVVLSLRTKLAGTCKIALPFSSLCKCVSVCFSALSPRCHLHWFCWYTVQLFFYKSFLDDLSTNQCFCSSTRSLEVLWLSEIKFLEKKFYGVCMNM